MKGNFCKKHSIHLSSFFLKLLIWPYVLRFGHFSFFLFLFSYQGFANTHSALPGIGLGPPTSPRGPGVGAQQERETREPPSTPAGGGEGDLSRGSQGWEGTERPEGRGAGTVGSWEGDLPPSLGFLCALHADTPFVGTLFSSGSSACSCPRFLLPEPRLLLTSPPALFLLSNTSPQGHPGASHPRPYPVGLHLACLILLLSRLVPPSQRSLHCPSPANAG